MDGLRGQVSVWEILTALPDLRALADLACRREGFTDGDRGAGVAYHHEIERLAQLDDMAEDDNIPAGHVQVFAGWGPPDGVEVVVPEAEYLATLAAGLDWRGFAAEAAQVRNLLAPKPAEPSAAPDRGRLGGAVEHFLNCVLLAPPVRTAGTSANGTQPQAPFWRGCCISPSRLFKITPKPILRDRPLATASR